MEEVNVPIRPGLTVLETDLIWGYFTKTFQDYRFRWFLFLSFSVWVISTICLLANTELISFETQNGHPGVIALIVLNLLLAIILAFLAYETSPVDSHYYWLFLAILVVWTLWTVSLFFSRFERGMPLLFSTFFFMIVFYYTLMIIKVNKRFLPWAYGMVLLVGYFLFYNLMVAKNPWKEGEES